MRLYSRGQLILIASATALVVALLAVGFGVFRDRPGDPGSVQTIAEPPDTFELSTSPQTSVLLATDNGQYSADELETMSLFEVRNDGVVNISTQRIGGYTWFLEPVPQEGSSGSGSIIDSRGYVLTNNHVIEGATTINITLADGTTLEGQVVGVDEETDLAVLQFDPGDRELTTIPMGNSSSLRVGQKVLAIGNPFAIGRTLTTGVISGLGRSLSTSSNNRTYIINGLIQTDASINPGNSGGPLLDSSGNMIGINTMIYSQSGGSIGIGFAVPVDTARRVVPDLIQYGAVRRGGIQLDPVQLWPQLVRYARLSVDEGVLVSAVQEGGNAEAAGLRGGDLSDPIRAGNDVIYLGGDVIIEVNGTPTATLSHLWEALEDTRPGDQVSVVYIRNGRQRETTVTLVDRAELSKAQ
jgi:S1-C subfamily serine protease